MKIKYLLVALLIVAGIALSGCTSASPDAIVSPTVLPTNLPTTVDTDNTAASPTPAAVVAPSAASSSGAVMARVGNLSVLGVSVDWDSTDRLQHDVAHVSLQSVATNVIQDVTVTYIVATPITLANPEGTTTILSNSMSNSVYVGKMSPTEVKDVTIQVPDHLKNVPATITILVSWKGGDGTVLQGTLSAPDGTLGTQKY